ncbi:hypothetical protein BIWAKO_05544 [Bosea sp. BIWAKO-01]|nr:hypothetical protein BIWAKO_05544 [Bosea sp. BIWAKO-01]
MSGSARPGSHRQAQTRLTCPAQNRPAGQTPRRSSHARRGAAWPLPDDQTEAMSIADTIAVMKAGQLQQGKAIGLAPKRAGLTWYAKS